MPPARGLPELLNDSTQWHHRIDFDLDRRVQAPGALEHTLEQAPVIVEDSLSRAKTATDIDMQPPQDTEIHWNPRAVVRGYLQW